jgi:hypothetical protein
MRHVRTAGYLIAYVLLICQSLQAAVSSLDERIVALAGEGARNCKSPATNDVAPGAVSEPCLVSAFRERKAAFWQWEDSPNRAGGVAVTASGKVYLLDEFAREYPCVEAAIVREFGKERLRCKERYNPPFKASELPLRTSGSVIAPKPQTKLEIPPEICDPAGPGRSVQVEFVVDTNGSVLMADVLVAAKQCNLLELEAALRAVKFSPGSYNGAPMITSWFAIIPVKLVTPQQH